MGQLLVRNLDDTVIEKLKDQALERGSSLEQVARDALSQAATRSDRQAWIARTAALRAQTVFDPEWDSAAEIRQAREELANRLTGDGYGDEKA